MTYALSANVRTALRDSDQRIVITGAGGWLGMATLELLGDAFGQALASRTACFGASRRTLTLLDGRPVEQYPLSAISDLAPRPSLVLHLAFLTKDRAEIMSEADYRRANRALSRQLLDALDPIGARAVFVASSGAARFCDDPARSAALRLYGELKRADEEAFAAWAETRERRAIVARLFNIAGPHINKLDCYALSSLILAALEGGIVRITAPHRVVRGYVAIRELMSLVFALLLDERPEVVRFDSGGAAMELAQVASVVATELGGIVERARVHRGDPDIYLGDGDRYDRLLIERSIELVPFRTQVRETGRYLQESARRGPNPEAIGMAHSISTC